MIALYAGRNRSPKRWDNDGGGSLAYKELKKILTSPKKGATTAPSTAMSAFKKAGLVAALSAEKKS